MKDECLTDDGGEINWDIETVEEPFVSSVTSESVDNVSVMTKSVRENEFSTVLEHDVTRNTFINELHEVKLKDAFFCNFSCAHFFSRWRVFLTREYFN